MASTPVYGVPSLNNPQVFFDKDLYGEALLNLVMTTEEDSSMEFRLTILQMSTSESETVAITADQNTPVNDWLRGIQQYFATKYSLESAFFHLENGQPIIMPQYLNKGSLLECVEDARSLRHGRILKARCRHRRVVRDQMLERSRLVGKKSLISKLSSNRGCHFHQPVFVYSDIKNKAPICLLQHSKLQKARQSCQKRN